jgi:hypothetical protein
MYQEQKFSLQGLKGLSEKQISEHLKLYAGYIKNVNINVTAFEWNGMRLHELYFEQLSESPSPIVTEGPVGKEIENLRKVAMTRGSGWALIVRD